MYANDPSECTVEHRLSIYLRRLLALMMAMIIASASLIFAFILWIAFLLTSFTKWPYLRSSRAKAPDKGPNVIEGEYEVLDEPQDARFSQDPTRSQQDKGTYR
jgi:hypothetical protein